jgi:hypothetical protein
LKEVEFLVEDIEELPKPKYNPLKITNVKDIPKIVPKLNNFLRKYKIKNFFTDDIAYKYFRPIKNIIYSFVNKNQMNEITDFVCINQSTLLCLEKNKKITVANLSFYFHETMTLTELIIYLIDKLSELNFDQLIYKGIGANLEINLTRFEGRTLYSYYGPDFTNQINPNYIATF